MIADLVLADTKAYIDKTIVECNIAIDDGKILKIGKETHMPKADIKIELKRLLVMPGLIDVHVHLRDEGKAYKEDFYTGTSAAAAGGITTVLDMPNNSPVTMSAGTLKNRIIAAERKVLVNVGFYSEFPKETEQLKNIVKVGAVGFKLYMAEQVGGLDIHDDQALLEAFTRVAELEKVTAVHAEDNEALKEIENKLKQNKRTDVSAFLKAHSEKVETKAVERLLSLMKQTIMHLHFCHVSTKQGLEMIADARKSGMSTTCETTPHNLLLSTDDFKRIGTLALTMPPVRDGHHIEALWNGVRSGSIDILASDHAPHILEEKEAETVWDVKVGIPGLETTLPLMLNEVRRGRLNIGDVVRLLAENPAKIFRLKGKGYLAEGNNADLTIVDLTKKRKIDASIFHSKAKYSPFDGREIEGVPVKTFVNGQLVMEGGEIIGKPGSGQIIRREWLEIRR